MDKVLINTIDWDFSQDIVPRCLEASSTPRGPAKVDIRVCTRLKLVYKATECNSESYCKRVFDLLEDIKLLAHIRGTTLDVAATSL